MVIRTTDVKEPVTLGLPCNKACAVKPNLHFSTIVEVFFVAHNSAVLEHYRRKSQNGNLE